MTAAAGLTLSGNFTITHTGYILTDTTGRIAWSECPTLQPAVETALRALLNINSVAVACSGTLNAAITLAVTFVDNAGTFADLSLT